MPRLIKPAKRLHKKRALGDPLEPEQVQWIESKIGEMGWNKEEFYAAYKNANAGKSLARNPERQLQRIFQETGPRPLTPLVKANLARTLRMTVEEFENGLHASSDAPSARNVIPTAASQPPAHSSTKMVSKPFTVDWILFAPFCPADSPRSVTPPNGLVCQAEDDESRTFVASADTRAELRWFDWGAAVWTLRTVTEFPNLAALAGQRRQTYRDVLKGQHLLRQLTERVNNAAKARMNEQPSCQTDIGYALSMFSLVEPGWQNEFTPHALQVLSCPNVILKLPEVEDVASASEIREKELEILQHGVGTADLHEFSQPGLVHGYACWAGVAAHINEALRPRMLNSCICFQQELQALWWRLHSLSASLNHRRPTDKEEEHVDKLRIAVQRTLRIGPTEVTALRLFKEAVIATSRFKSVFEEFQEIYRATRNAP